MSMGRLSEYHPRKKHTILWPSLIRLALDKSSWEKFGLCRISLLVVPSKRPSTRSIIRRGIQPQGVQIPLKTPPLYSLCRHASASWPPHPPPCHGGWPSPARPSRMKFQPRPGFEALEVRGGRIFRSKHCFCYVPPEGPWRALESPGAPWKPPEAAWNCVETLTMMGSALGTLDWDLRWIMTRALLRDTRSFSYRFVARSQNTFRLLVKCLWTPEGFQAPNAMCLWTPEGFQAPNAIH